MVQNFILLIFPQPFKNVKIILSSQAIQRQVAGQICPEGSNVNSNQAKYVFLETEHLVFLSTSFVCLNQLGSLTDVFRGNGDISFYNAEN